VRRVHQRRSAPGSRTIRALWVVSRGAAARHQARVTLPAATGSGPAWQFPIVRDGPEAAEGLHEGADHPGSVGRRSRAAPAGSPCCSGRGTGGDDEPSSGGRALDRNGRAPSGRRGRRRGKASRDPRARGSRSSRCRRSRSAAAVPVSRVSPSDTLLQSVPLDSIVRPPASRLLRQERRTGLVPVSQRRISASVPGSPGRSGTCTTPGRPSARRRSPRPSASSWSRAICRRAGGEARRRERRAMTAEDLAWADAVFITGMHIQRPFIDSINARAHARGSSPCSAAHRFRPARLVPRRGPPPRR